MIIASSALTRQHFLGIHTARGEMDGDRLSVAFNKAKLNLIRLPYKLMSDLAFAPKLCFRNTSRREAKEERNKNDEPIFTRTFLDRFVFFFL